MPIKIGENPEKTRDVNKFISVEGGGGYRGRVIAVHKDKKHAIVLAKNGDEDGPIKWGRLYLVEEIAEDKWPIVMHQIGAIPNLPEWKIVV